MSMATSFFYIYAMATSFFYIYVMATSFFYIYIDIYKFLRCCCVYLGNKIPGMLNPPHRSWQNLPGGGKAECKYHKSCLPQVSFIWGGKKEYLIDCLADFRRRPALHI